MAPPSLITAAPAPRGELLRHPAAVAPSLVAVVALAVATLPADKAVVAAFAGAVLVVLSVIDLERGIIPNQIVLPAAGVVLLVQVALFPGRAPEWILATILAALILMIPQLVKRPWMGMGDVKLALLLGATLGWGVIGAVFLAFLCAFPVALALLVRHGTRARKMTIPFGPFLSLGGLIVLFAPHISGLPAS
ncbi:MAG: prepilin peptidase [Solirubrobacterales bacterium]|nr:prepilin peptidase [Solirubrobacterales bacterium]